ncbi:MAG: hypothetical protein JSW59_08265, partial [Phycisphaerales bacterium]
MIKHQRRIFILFAILAGAVAAICRPCYADQASDIESLYVRQDTLQETLHAWRGRIGKQTIEVKAHRRLSMRILRDFPIQWEWIEQDCGADFFQWLGGRMDAAIEKKMVSRVLDELGPAGNEPTRKFERLCESGALSTDRRWLDLYIKTCEMRRAIRLKSVLEKCERIVFTKHFNMGGSHYAYTEAQSDAQHESNFI